jgi:hypothetical protein
MKNIIVAMTIVLGLIAPTASAEQLITHVVVVWVNDDVSDKQVSKIIEDTQVLRSINVVQDLKVGRPVASERASVDDSFSFALSVTFKNSADMQAYIIDETHIAYVKSAIKPVLKKIVVYDF